MVAREIIRRLMDVTSGPCISLYMPAHGSKDALPQNPIRLKNLLREAGDRLLERGVKELDARRLLEPAWRLVQERPFWQDQHGGVGLFLAPDFFDTIQAPIVFPEEATVADAFSLKPLFPLLNADREFYILSLCQKKVRLLHATAFAVEAVEVPGMPTGMTEALGYEVHDRQVLARTGAPRGAGQRSGTYYGMGSEERDEKEEALRFFRLVDGALHEHLGGQRVPLVLAAVQYLVPIYKEANTYPYLMEDAVIGHPEDFSPIHLQASALEVVQPYFERALRDAAARYRELEGTGRTAADLGEILPAARHGRVEALFVDQSRQRWGRFALETDETEVHGERQPGDQDLLDLAVLQVYTSGGTVFAVDAGQVPGQQSAAALLRY